MRAFLPKRLPLGRILAVAGSIAILVGLLLWAVFSGGLNTSAGELHSRPMAWALHTIMTRSVGSRAGHVRPPDAFTAAQTLAGSQDYMEHCVACHGGPGVGRAPWASALNPTPPYLIDASRRWSRAELYVIVRDGVKMSAMPAWSEVEPERNVWNTVAFLEAMPHLSPAGFARLRSAAGSRACGPATGAANGESTLGAAGAPVGAPSLCPCRNGLYLEDVTGAHCERH